MGEMKGPGTGIRRAGFRLEQATGGRHPHDRSPPASWLSPLHHRGLISELRPQELGPRVQQGPRSQMPLWGGLAE